MIKCDIEGAEYAALEGALKLLKAAAPIIFLATHGPEIHEQCCQLLTTLHYSLHSLDDSPLVSTTEILAVPQSKHR